jgi:hypothetical protein
MDYMFLIYADEAKREEMTPERKASSINRSWAVIDEATARGVFKGARPLESTRAAFTARARQGKIGITDGPFAETKEALGGYYIIDCADLEDARYWAGRLAQTGCGASIEFRPLCAIPQRQDTIAPENEVASTVNA